MKILWTNKIFWEVIGYIILIGLLVAQIIAGEKFLLAQVIYLFVNVAGIVRDIALKLPTANTMRDIVFTIVTTILIFTVV